MYTDCNFKSSKALREAVVTYLLTLCGRKSFSANWRAVTYFQPGPFSGNEKQDGEFVVEGPHYPKPHSFYIKCIARAGVIVWCSGLPATLNPTAPSYNLSKGIAALRTKYPEIDAVVNPKPVLSMDDPQVTKAWDGIK
jgi:hypothetical protein